MIPTESGTVYGKEWIANTAMGSSRELGIYMPVILEQVEKYRGFPTNIRFLYGDIDGCEKYMAHHDSLDPLDPLYGCPVLNPHIHILAKWKGPKPE
jgi:hypothetical protein